MVEAGHIHSRCIAVAAASLAIAVALVGARMSGGGADAFVVFGGDSPQARVAEQVLGRPVATASAQSHDGTIFWAQARDPLFADPQAFNRFADRPSHRAQRMLYPTLVAPFGLAGEEGILWGLLAVNLMVVAVGGYLTARLAIAAGAAPIAGLAFVLNPVVLLGVSYDLADPLAAAAVVAVVLAVRLDRWLLATVAAVAAVLAKEVMFVAVAGLAVGATATLRRRVTLVLAPVLAAGAWGLALRWRLGWSGSQVGEFTLVPFAGWLTTWRDAWSVEAGGTIDLVVALLALIVGGAILVRWWRRRTLELWAAVPFGLMLPLCTLPVLHRGIDVVRVLGPAITLLVVDVAAARHIESPIPEGAPT